MMFAKYICHILFISGYIWIQIAELLHPLPDDQDAESILEVLP